MKTILRLRLLPPYPALGSKTLIYSKLCLVLMLVLASCQKESLFNDQSITPEDSGPIVFNVSDQSVMSRSSDSTGLIQTILGDNRQNPFTVEKMAEAHRNLYDSGIQQMEATELYIKFMPSSLEHISALEQTDVFLYDFPLEYEVLEMGDYYQEVNEGTYPELYAIVSLDFVFPDVPYQTIAQLYLDRSDPLLIAESFKLTGNEDEIHSYILNSTGLLPGDLGDEVQPLIPEPPECPPGCIAVLNIDITTTPVSWEWICDCNPPPPPPPTINSCGCEVYPNRRKPGGCVKVEDTQLSTPWVTNTYAPVRRVKVIMKDSWFTQDKTWTDDGGCWKINNEYKGRAWMWITFKNDRCRIRGTEKNWRAVYQWLITINDFVGMMWGPTFNDISVNYHMWTSLGSKGHLYWGAATVNNALHEFHDFAASDGISTPPDDLDIYIGRNHRYGYTLMSAQNGLSSAAAAAMGLATYWTGPFAPVIAIVGWAFWRTYLPDVKIGIKFENSDQLKSLAYHEIAHASHYAQVGSAYWEQLVYAEIFANGHGDQYSNGADIIAVCESWAEYLGGHHYVHRSYGNATSIGRTWESLVERTWNETPNHIPIGLHHDLVDIGEPPLDPSTMNTACNQKEAGCAVINDDVSGFSNAQMFSCLTYSTSSIDEYQDCMRVKYLGSTSNNTTDFDNLYNSY